MKNKSAYSTSSILLKVIIILAVGYAVYFVVNSFILVNDAKSYSLSKTESLDSLKLDTALYDVLSDEMLNLSEFQYEKFKNGESVIRYKLGEKEVFVYQLPLTVNAIRINKGTASPFIGFYKTHPYLSGIDLLYRYKEMAELKGKQTNLEIVSDGDVDKESDIITFQDAEFIDFKFDDRATICVKVKRKKASFDCKIHKVENNFIIRLESLGVDEAVK